MPDRGASANRNSRACWAFLHTLQVVQSLTANAFATTCTFFLNRELPTNLRIFMTCMGKQYNLRSLNPAVWQTTTTRDFFQMLFLFISQFNNWAGTNDILSLSFSNALIILSFKGLVY
jgi:hypothetical protein